MTQKDIVELVDKGLCIECVYYRESPSKCENKKITIAEPKIVMIMKRIG